ncbi:MAG: tetratricopeptide repeat protein [Alphaproteobacteria bacterium]|jgi:tetratricopeptide (TPR) repeat protein|nr:tetratricopeptide repeat protein [Alphaproteobacteria bacterium]
MKKQKKASRRKTASKKTRKIIKPVSIGSGPVNPITPEPASTSGKETLAQAVAALQAGRGQEALKLCSQVLSSDPGDTEALNLAGVAAFQTGDGAQGRELLETALAFRPDFTDAHNNLGNVLEAQGLFVEAEASYRRCIALNAGAVSAHFHLGNVLKALGRLSEAQEAYKRVLAITPDHAEALNNTGAVDMELGCAADAIHAYRKAIGRNPGFAEAHYNLGIALQKTGELDAALDSYRRALSCDSGHAGAQINIGYAYKEMGRLEEAEKAYRAAIRMAPDYDKVQVNLGDLYLQQGNPQAAVDVCDAYLADHPGNISILAFKSIALTERSSVDNSFSLDEAHALYDFDRLLRPVRPACPEGFADMAEFNRALSTHVLGHPSLSVQPTSHATRSGRHSGELLIEPKGPVAALETVIMTAVDDFRTSVPTDASHPWLGRRPDRMGLSVWGVAMDSQGHQLAHIHPSAWLSGVYYPKIPAVVRADDPGHAGWIEFGRAPEDFHSSTPPEVRLIRPEEGLMVLFPSYFYHRTVPFESDEVRISIAFDVLDLDL